MKGVTGLPPDERNVARRHHSGHPDPAGGHYGHGLADAYAKGAAAAGHELQRTQAEFEQAAPVSDIRNAQDTILWADHLVILYPLWLGTMPALLKAFLEQVLRPGFAFDESKRPPRKLLKGRSARIVVTMGLSAFIYRWYFGAHGLRSPERSVLEFCGIRPIRASLIGMVEGGSAGRRAKWLDRLRALGGSGPLMLERAAWAQRPGLLALGRTNKTVLPGGLLA